MSVKVELGMNPFTHPNYLELVQKRENQFRQAICSVNEKLDVKLKM